MEDFILKAALEGLEQQKATIEEQIGDVRREVYIRTSKNIFDRHAVSRPKRKMSAAGRKAVSQAQKARWEAYHKAQKQAVIKAEKRGKK